jgi:hypothetical protein
MTFVCARQFGLIRKSLIPCSQTPTFTCTFLPLLGQAETKTITDDDNTDLAEVTKPEIRPTEHDLFPPCSLRVAAREVSIMDRLL